VEKPHLKYTNKGNNDQSKEAFLKIKHVEDNDNERQTFTELVKKMEELLGDKDQTFAVHLMRETTSIGK